MLMSIAEQIQRHESGSYAETTLIIGGVIALVALLIRIIFGAYGMLETQEAGKSSYRLVKTVEASSKENAIYHV